MQYCHQLDRVRKERTGCSPIFLPTITDQHSSLALSNVPEFLSFSDNTASARLFTSVQEEEAETRVVTRSVKMHIEEAGENELKETED